MKKIIKPLILIIALIIALVFILSYQSNKTELKTIKSEKQLLKIYNGDTSEPNELAIKLLTLPFSIMTMRMRKDIVYQNSYEMDVSNEVESVKTPTISPSDSISSFKEYSTTNIQVENVDEADIVKTDGDYIYSISDNYVVITNVNKPEEIKIESKIQLYDGSIPEDLILNKNQLIIISSKFNNSYRYSYYDNSNTVVTIYDIKSKENPVLIKSYELKEPYYTSRCIGNKLYVISSGYLRKDDDKIERSYVENSVEKKIELNNIKYLKDVKTTKQTLISFIDLNNPREDVKVDSYLIDISNAYVSEESIYLLNQQYEYRSGVPSIRQMFGLKGIFELFSGNNSNLNQHKTEIYKFNINKDGKIQYGAKNKIEGKTINQYSLDEKENHLRVALYDNKGSRIAIFDENLKQIGISDYVAKGETMYSSRFIGDKAYFVTFRTMDPLFVIDLSNETKPTVLGELKIPGYSTYLHPYDENHIIGIGMETEEITNRNNYGKVISTTSRIIGMKMALFDISDVNNPLQISQTIIGDSRTTSAILTNPKALLFSKEKELIAIPVNNYAEDFEINTSTDNYSTMINSYKSYKNNRIGEGYFVYKINLIDGFNLKGIINHESKNNNELYYYNKSKLLRGLYIDDNLYTVSENEIKVNKLETLDLINELKISFK